MGLFRIVGRPTDMLKNETQEKFEEMPFTFTSKVRILFFHFFMTFMTISLLRYFDHLLVICIKLDISDFAITSIFFQSYLEIEYFCPVIF